jgi:hypothetical protein
MTKKQRAARALSGFLAGRTPDEIAAAIEAVMREFDEIEAIAFNAGRNSGEHQPD